MAGSYYVMEYAHVRVENCSCSTLAEKMCAGNGTAKIMHLHGKESILAMPWDKVFATCKCAVLSNSSCFMNSEKLRQRTEKSVILFIAKYLP